MDRFQSFLRFGFAVRRGERLASRSALERVLHPLHERIRREPGADAAHRPAVLEEAVFRGAAHDTVAQRTRTCGQSQASGVMDAGDGSAGTPARAAHEQGAPRTSNLPAIFCMESGFCVTALERALHTASPGIFNMD